MFKRLRCLTYILIFTTSQIGITGQYQKTLHFIIYDSFKQNKKVWGTYTQYKRIAKLNNFRVNKSKLAKLRSNPLGSMTFKKNNMFFIKESQNDLSDNFEMKDHKYKFSSYKKRNSPFRVYNIVQTNDNSSKLFQIYRTSINDLMLKTLDLSSDYLPLYENDVHFDHLKCRKFKKYIHCKISVRIGNNNPQIIY